MATEIRCRSNGSWCVLIHVVSLPQEVNETKIIVSYCIMKLSVDNQQRLTASAIMLLEFYKVTMGTFLVIFVPQQCGDEVCSLYDNLTNDFFLNRAALACNFAAFVMVLGFYGIEIKRESEGSRDGER